MLLCCTHSYVPNSARVRISVGISVKISGGT